MAYKELRNEYSLTLTTQSQVGRRAYIDTDAGSCTISSIPVIGDPFSVAYLGCKLRKITATPYHQDHSAVGTNKNKFKYTCDYSSVPDPVRYEENHYGVRYTGGTSLISLSLDKNGSEWKWIKVIGDTTRSSAILGRQVFVKEVKGTYSTPLTIPAVARDGRVSWETFLTGGGSADYGINNSLGKINTNPVKISPTATETFKSGQLYCSSYDCSAMVDQDGYDAFYVTLNFSYSVVDLINGSAVNKNVDYPWIYVINDKAESGDFQYQIPTKSTPAGSFPEDGIYMYDFADFGTTLDPTP